jgi:lipoyl(octanoyl) transferase
MAGNSRAGAFAEILKRSPLVDRTRVRLIDFGLGDYGEVLALQESLRESRRKDAVPDTWLMGEHRTVITQGVRGREADVLGGRGGGGVDVVWVDRGGQTTLHSPGQMILYPIVKLGGGSLAGPRMTHALLEGLRAWLIATHGVEAEIPRGRPGLFIGDRKLMSIGISVRGGVSMHGIAMNLCNDPALWDRIVACGEPGTRPVTLSELLGRRIEPKAQGESIGQWLREAWGYAEVVTETHVSGGRR